MDTITVLGVRQHIAFILTLVLGWALWWWFRCRAHDLSTTPGLPVGTVQIL